MHIQNHTNQILVFGRTTIPPQQSGMLSEEFEDHPTVDLLIRLRKISSTEHVVAKAKKPRPVLPILDTEETPTVVFETDDQIPEGWDEFHANKCYAWIRKQNNPVLLGKMAAIEDRKKVRSRLEFRITEIS